VGTRIELVEPNLTAEGIAVNSEQARGAGLVAPRPVQNTLDEFLFKFIDGFVELYPAFHHLSDQRFQLIFHLRTLPTRIVRGRAYRPE
jgi:hypothetical protein